MDIQQNPFKILVVCTGNICRSPMGERLLQAGLDAVSPGGFEVRSAGTFGLTGRPMTPQSAGLTRLFGGNPDHFRARRVHEAMVREQDLVIVLTRDHRDKIISLAPSHLKKTFTLRELGRIVEKVRPDLSGGDPRERWAALVAQAARLRAQEAPKAPEEDDVVDPYQLDDSVYQQMAQEMVPAIHALVRFEQQSGTRAGETPVAPQV